jgi:glycosyltransferase involved in cell wall biosynthesis
MKAQRRRDAKPAEDVEEAAKSKQPPKPRILFVINSLSGGGAERVMTTLLAHSEDRLASHDFALAVLDDAPRAYSLPPWLKIFQLDCRGGMLSSLSAIDKLVGEFDPHLTVSFLARANFTTTIAMMKRKRPRIISERTSTPAHLGSRLRRLATKVMMRVAYPRATRIIAVSASLAEKLTQCFGVHADRVAIVPNPIDADALEVAARERNEPPIDGPYVIAVGRLVRVKNFQLLLRAFATAGLPSRLVIAGDGPERDSLEGLAAKLGIAERVIFTGWLRNPYPVLSNATVFALSSDIEGFPNALLEALAFGVPVVATNCADGPAEILAARTREDFPRLTVTEAGILTPPGDLESFAEALRMAFEERLRGDLSAGGRQRSKNYSAAAITAEYWDIIDRELERAEAPRGTQSRAAASGTA